MIKWPDLVFPAINLWNCPRQEEIEMINAAKAELNRLHRKIENDVLNIDSSIIVHNKLCAKIKEREFLYYLHSGRFPE